MSDPVTTLHYAANGNFVNGVYAPGADGFNLADVSSVDDLNSLPTGVKGLAYLGLTGGVTSSFISTVSAFIGNPNLYGFYLVDEPDGSATTAANLKAESDWIHANVPGAKTFMVEQNLSGNTTPVFYYTPANTDIDLFGLDPYPVQTNVPNNLDYNIINLAVSTAEADGIPQSAIVPVYQAFGGGGYTTYILPTAAQEQQILSTWGSVVPTPAFDYAYSWATQDGDTALGNDPALQAVFAAYNAAVTVIPGAPTISGPVNGSTDSATSKPAISGSGVAGDTVTVSIDGTVAGTTTVAAGGGWTYTPTSALSNASHTVTATQAAAGGPSSTAASDTFTVNVVTAPGAPTLTIANSSLTVAGGGGTVALGISVAAPASETATVTITGLPRYERITDSLDGESYRGSTITLSEAQVDSGLTLTSRYRGSSFPVATLTVTASDAGGTSTPQTITVTDPPTSTAALGSNAALLGSPPSTSNYGLDYHGSSNSEFATISALLSGDQGMGSGLSYGAAQEHATLGLYVAASVGPKTG